MDSKVTMQDIADMLDITKVSVSKAINNQPGISDNLREQILTTAKKMGYHKTNNREKSTSYNFAWICPKRFFLEDETFYTTIYYYINKRLMEKDHTISCFVINDKEESENKLPLQFSQESFDGIFIAGEFERSYLKKLEMIDCAKIAIDFYLPDMNIDSIVTDNFYTGFEATNYLIRKGHMKIGFVGNINNTSSICDRYFGYLKALMLNDLPVRNDWRIVNNDPVTGAYTLDFSLPKELPTSFVCHCDKAAFILMQKLHIEGYKVPEDVSVISFDNTSICELTIPKLTSIDINRKQIALQSIDQMLRRLEHTDSSPRKIYLGGHLVERDSITSPRKEQLIP
ncbi:MAG: LacI family DNA-binding transcriptional regulator [Clostridiales bacterium]|nr:LacI family DNA-binding transcriptional regulator [Clostridiales bacterium]